MCNSIHPRWKSFPISEIFYVYSGKRLTKSEMKPGSRPFIGATDSNNGITEWVNNSNDSLDSNVLGVNYNGSVCEAFYHPYECIFSDDVKRLHLKDHIDSKYIMLFLKTVILQQKCKYAYGYKFNEQRMLRQTIVLPVDNEGNPDWAFMENYMRNKETKLLKPIIDALCNRLITNELGGNLANCNWLTFQLDNVFDIKATKSSIDKKNLIKEAGTIPYITRTDKNNGIDMLVCEQPGYDLDEGNVITIGLDTQTAFYQSIPFYTGQNIQVLRHPALNRYVASFILIMIKNLMVKFNWGGNGATLTRLKRSKILLPVKEDKSPDWGFMENFMRNVENDILSSTLRYFRNLQNVNKCEMGG